MQNRLPKNLIILCSLFFVLSNCISEIGNSQKCEQYDRSLYGGWIDADGDCQDTRQEVLIEENIGLLEFETSNNCRVISGKWFDVYYGDTILDPSGLDIDHVIPLAEAHKSGGWKWDDQKKKDFANYLKDSIHLIAVSASANRSKGARDPSEWLPSNTKYVKTYAENWVNLKIEWGLSANESEILALKKILGDTFVMPTNEDEAICIEPNETDNTNNSSSGGSSSSSSSGGSSSSSSGSNNTNCCKTCKTGKACGDSCISKKYRCTKPVGCACNG